MPTELPIAERFSLAGELIDADADDLLDIWITRDVGWARGGDTVLSRQGEPGGEWVDVAPDLGVALEVDGMGITLADLDGDDIVSSTWGTGALDVNLDGVSSAHGCGEDVGKAGEVVTVKTDSGIFNASSHPTAMRVLIRRK